MHQHTATPPPKRYGNALHPLKEQRERIILLSEKFLKRFPVFLDREVGIARQYCNYIQENEEDEDCDSTEEGIELGLKECLNILQSADAKEGEELSRSDYDTKPTVKPHYLSQTQQSRGERTSGRKGAIK